MEVYEQDYKTTIRVSFESLEKTHEASKDFWCGDTTKEDTIASIGRAFKYESSSWHKGEKTWHKFLEGYGEFFRIEESRGEGDVYRHESPENGIIEVWYEQEFEEDFSATLIEENK